MAIRFNSHTTLMAIQINSHTGLMAIQINSYTGSRVFYPVPQPLVTLFGLEALQGFRAPRWGDYPTQSPERLYGASRGFYGHSLGIGSVQSADRQGRLLVR